MKFHYGDKVRVLSVDEYDFYGGCSGIVKEFDRDDDNKHGYKTHYTIELNDGKKIRIGECELIPKEMM